MSTQKPNICNNKNKKVKQRLEYALDVGCHLAFRADDASSGASAHE